MEVGRAGYWLAMVVGKEGRLVRVVVREGNDCRVCAELVKSAGRTGRTGRAGRTEVVRRSESRAGCLRLLCRRGYTDRKKKIIREWNKTNSSPRSVASSLPVVCSL